MADEIIPLPPLNPPPAPAVPTVSPAPRRWFRWLIALLVLMGGAGGLGWYFYPTPVPQPPVVPRSGVDPGVVAALEVARDKVLAAPRTAEPWGNLGMSFRAHGFNAEANECFLVSQRLDPRDSRWPYLLGTDALLHDPHHALPHLQRAVEIGHPDPAYESAARLRLAETLLDHGRVEEATTLFHAELERDPASARSNFGLGLVAITRNDWKTGIEHLTLVASSPFARKKIAFQLAAIHTRLGNEPLATRYRQESVRLPDDLLWPDPYIEEWMRREEGRHKQFRQISELEDKGRIADANRLLRTLVREYPDARTYIALGINLCKMGDFQQAEQMLRTTVRLVPDHVQGHYFLCVALFFQGEALWQQGEKIPARLRFQEAAEVGKQTTDLKPDHGLAHLFRGRALRYLEQYPAALAALREAVTCRPESSETHFYLGEALEAAGQTELARGAYQEAARLAPEKDPRPRQALERLGAQPQPK